ncbi:MAG: hypothetical protein IPL27_03770 [Lewinellaceae bacterium]|nr:hypothetical protein [Lewinellaceae bacterium]
MKTPQTGVKHRYPGIRAFEQEESDLFFGRAHETAELFSMVKVRPLTVLFSKSGIGKTSLLNAGLIPLLRRNFFLPVKIRLQDTSISPANTLKRVLTPYLQAHVLQQNVPGATPETCSIWQFLRACSFQNEGVDALPVLVFDQFEEFFNHVPAERDELIDLLSDLINERLPAFEQEQFRGIPRRERTDEQMDWYTPIKARVVFSIRADRMSQLDDLKVKIPTVLHDRFHLKPLGHLAASTAIIEPAQKESAEFATPPFEYEPDVLAEMLDALSNKFQEIESFQLQLLCRHVEQQVRQRYANKT